MTELSKDELEEIVARVTANVLREMKAHEAEIRTGLIKPGEVSWICWLTALPANIRIDQGQAPVGSGAPEDSRSTE
jgi:hypothetical protein